MNKIMKRTMIGALAAVLSLGALTACNQETGNAGKTPITVVSREDGSGTRTAFVELFGVEEKDESGKKVDQTTLEAITTNSTSVMMTTVAGEKNAIGYISLGSLNDTVKALKIDGTEPSAQAIKNGSYKIARPFNIATRSGASAVTQDFIAFIMSAEGQKIIADNNYIPVDHAAPYAGSKPSGKIVIAGSSSVAPVMEKLKEGYEKINSGAEISIQANDSTTGMNYVAEGVCDIGMASRELKDSELEKGITPTVIAQDGIAVIVNKENTIDGLSAQQIKEIFIGTVTDWSELA